MKNQPKPAQRPYKENFSHHSKRRKRGHDYCAPWKYHITIAKHPSAPQFSTLAIRQLRPDAVTVATSPIGQIIEQEIKAFEIHHPDISILNHIIMPDHVHMLVHVRRRLQKAVGSAIGGLKTGIAKECRTLLADPDASIFESGFNDKIIYSFRSLDDVMTYIDQNPYRLAVRRYRPDFFRKTRDIDIAGTPMQAYGNLFLFRNPFKTSLVVHRADSDEVFAAKRERCLDAAANGGVVVSAFISPREKQIQREIEAMQGKIIKLHHQPFGEREKPARHDFDLCADGQLLLLSPLAYAALPPRDHPSREQCLHLNRLAQLLSAEALPPKQ